MPRTCTICNHTDRDKMDRALLAGEPYRNIAKQYGTSYTALFRHKQEDIPAALMKAHEAAEVSRADSWLWQLNRLAADARRIQQKAEAAKDYRAALAGVRELTRLVELVAKLSGQMAEPQANGPVEIRIVYDKRPNNVESNGSR